jgi:Tfp pilus assembly protein PilX
VDCGVPLRAIVRLRAAAVFACLKRDERGIALAMAVPILAVITIMLFTALHLGAASSRGSSFSDSSQKAFHLAEAGVNNALAVLAEDGNDPTNASLLPARTTTYSGGTVTWSGKLDGDVWTITGVSSVPNPTGAGATPITRTVTRKARVTSEVSMTGNEAWNYVYSDSEALCVLPQNTVMVAAPLYIRGDLCLKNSASYRGPELNVRGTVQTDDFATVGTSSTPVPLVRVKNGCRYTSSGLFVPACSASEKVWATTFNNEPPELTKPVIDLPHAYLTAKPGPNQYCTTGSFPGGPSSFDNDLTRNGSGPAVDIMPATGYDCTVTEFGNTVGRIVWTPGTPGTLIVEGTIFFDGELMMSDSRSAVYSGEGVIYVSKKIKFANNREICGVASCNPSTWDPNTNLLVFISGAPDVPAIEMDNQAKFQGAIYAVGGFKLQNEATMQGPVIADLVDVQNNGLANTWPELTGLFDGLPTTGVSQSTVELLPDWSG